MPGENTFKQRNKRVSRVKSRGEERYPGRYRMRMPCGKKA